jgi:hypothetical protein
MGAISHRKGSLVGPRSGVGIMKRETSYNLKGKNILLFPVFLSHPDHSLSPM